MIRKISLGELVDALPTNAMFYRFCRRYVEHYNGEKNSDMHSNGELRWLRQVLPQCKVVFDVGANVGDWTALALSINPAIHVHCSEPSTATFQHLQARSLGGARLAESDGTECICRRNDPASVRRGGGNQFALLQRGAKQRTNAN
jgi:hypothetical protein